MATTESHTIGNEFARNSISSPDGAKNEKISPASSYNLDTTAGVKYDTEVEVKDLENSSSEGNAEKPSRAKTLFAKYKIFGYVFFELLMTG